MEPGAVGRLLGMDLSRRWSRGSSRAPDTPGLSGGCTGSRRSGSHTSCLPGRPPGWSGIRRYLEATERTGVSGPRHAVPGARQGRAAENPNTRPARAPTQCLAHRPQVLPKVSHVESNGPASPKHQPSDTTTRASALSTKNLYYRA